MAANIRSDAAARASEFTAGTRFGAVAGEKGDVRVTKDVRARREAAWRSWMDMEEKVKVRII
jgi:hypothetical protein